MSLRELLFSDKIHQSWKDEFTKEIEVIEDTGKLLGEINPTDICPSMENTFKCFEMVPLSELKVVIWGQDPYPSILEDGTPRAQGYAFGVRKDDEVPGSLKNIYKEIKSNYEKFKIPRHGDLSEVSRQGVLFMNYSLLYCISEPLKYRKKWARFTNMVIRIINENKTNVIHVLWGKDASKLKPQIKSRYVLESAHPSPLSCNRGFFGCNHFKKINIILDRDIKTAQINWNLLNNEKLDPTYVADVEK